MSQLNIVCVVKIRVRSHAFPNQACIKVGTPENKTDRRSIRQLSVQIVQELQIVLELSLNKTKDMIAVLRKGMDKRSSIESNIFEKLNEIKESISKFYEVEKVMGYISID